MGVYYTSNILENDEVSYQDIASIFTLDENARWLNRAVTRFVEDGWAEGPLMLGDPSHQPIELTALGLREAERLIESNKFVLERIDDATGSIKVPASDRIISLDHNQITVAETSINELVGALEADNGDPEHPGFREQLLGEVRAGRELVKAGTFRAYLIYETLVRALNNLIKRYKNPTIAALANALLGTVVSQLIQG